jgi:exopolysaccharide production protein ExoQ
MKELILGNPVILIFFIALGILYTFLLFHFAGRAKKFSSNLEKVFLGIFIISIAGATGVTLNPFDKLNPNVMALRNTTMPTIVGQIGIYLICLFLLTSRLRYTLKNFINACTELIIKEPFLVLLFLIIGLSSFWSTDPNGTLKASVVYLETTIIAIYVGKQYSWQKLFSLWRWINITVVILSIYQAITANQVPWMGILGHKNQFSFYMAQSAILWLMHSVYSPKQRYLSIVFSLLSLIALNQGGSGTSKVLTVVLLGLWAYFGFLKRLPVKWAVVSVILFMIMSVCLTIVVTDNLEFIVVDTLNKDMTLTGRTDFWPMVIAKINQRPFLGYGVNGFWQPWRLGDNPAGDIIVAKTQFRPPHAHNGFLDLGLDLGWIGVSLYALSFFNNVVKSVIYLSRNHLPESGLPLLLLTYTLMTNMTETGLVGVTSIWFWYVVTTVRLTLDTSKKNYSEHQQRLKSVSLSMGS